eukprot:g763.t1
MSTSSTETNTVMTNTSIEEEKDVQNRGKSDKEITTAANERTSNVSATVVEGTAKKARRSTPRKKLRRKKDEAHSSHDNDANKTSRRKLKFGIDNSNVKVKAKSTRTSKYSKKNAPVSKSGGCLGKSKVTLKSKCKHTTKSRQQHSSRKFQLPFRVPSTRREALLWAWRDKLRFEKGRGNNAYYGVKKTRSSTYEAKSSRTNAYYLGSFPEPEIAAYVVAKWERSKLCTLCLKSSENCNDEVLLCDFCDREHHFKCLGITKPPSGTWFCPICSSLDQDDSTTKTNALLLDIMSSSSTTNDDSNLVEMNHPEVKMKRTERTETTTERTERTKSAEEHDEDEGNQKMEKRKTQRENNEEVDISRLASSLQEYDIQVLQEALELHRSTKKEILDIQTRSVSTPSVQDRVEALEALLSSTPEPQPTLDDRIEWLECQVGINYLQMRGKGISYLGDYKELWRDVAICGSTNENQLLKEEENKKPEELSMDITATEGVERKNIYDRHLHETNKQEVKEENLATNFYRNHEKDTDSIDQEVGDSGNGSLVVNDSLSLTTTNDSLSLTADLSHRDDTYTYSSHYHHNKLSTSSTPNGINNNCGKQSCLPGTSRERVERVERRIGNPLKYRAPPRSPLFIAPPRSVYTPP